MSNIGRNAVSWLEAKRRAHMTSPATYRRGEEEVELYLTLGQPDADQLDADGVAIGERSQEFLLAADAIRLSGVVSRPQQGDEIEIALDGGSETFELFTSDSRPVWSFDNLEHSRIRVQTQRKNRTT